MWTLLPQPKAGLTSVMPTALAICQRKEGRKGGRKKGRKGAKEGRGGEEEEEILEISPKHAPHGDSS